MQTKAEEKERTEVEEGKEGLSISGSEVRGWGIWVGEREGTHGKGVHL